MQAYKWFVAFIMLVSLGVGGFSLAVGAATAPLSVPNEPATLHVEAGRVELKQINTETWIEATEGAVIIPGDSLKTDSTGEASINLFDQGEIRLDHDTEITLTDAVWNANTPDVFLGSVFLSTGKLWSRLFDFVSPDSGFNVRTESTVATVRGTVFSVSALPDGGAWVYVDDHTVNIKTPTDSQSIRSGQHAQIAKDAGRFAITRKDIPDDKFVDWISKNRQRDVDFDARIRAKWHKKLSQLMTFTRIAEPLRLAAAFDGQKKEALKKRFGLRTKLLTRLESVRHNDLPTAPATIKPEITTTTSVESIIIQGLPGESQTYPLNTEPIVTEPKVIVPRLY
ncbi:MAG: FecR family protein [Patescibacteria group bacterium]